MIKFTKEMSNLRFDMSLTDTILVIKILRISERLVLSQPYYVDKIIEKFNKDDNRMTHTPINTSQYLSKKTRVRASLRYRTLK